MRRLWILVLAATAVSAQTQTPEWARQVVDDALRALGGEKFLAMRDRVEEGRSYAFYREDLSGMSRVKFYVRYLTPPEPMQAGFLGQRERRAFGKKEDVYIIYNEDGGWEITYRGAKPMTAEMFESYKETLLHNVLYTLRMRLKEPGLTFDPVGTDIVDRQPCNVVRIVDGANRQTMVWFHQTTKLPVRQQWERRDPKLKFRIEEVTIFDKYRDVGGGVQWPFVVRRERNGERNFEMYADSVTINRGLGDELFTLPAGLKMLEPGGSNLRPGRK
ncbi:MAG: hypothetical protein N2036_12515 [Bryobacteraceae bacterium]|nr:hypothetical protein [Bryobacteraceae bacterium]